MLDAAFLCRLDQFPLIFIEECNIKLLLQPGGPRITKRLSSGSRKIGS